MSGIGAEIAARRALASSIGWPSGVGIWSDTLGGKVNGVVVGTVDGVVVVDTPVDVVVVTLEGVVVVPEVVAKTKNIYLYVI